MAVSLLAHRCWNHGERTAAAECRACGRHFCRECIAEHGRRMICAACLAQEAADQTVSRNWLGAGARGLGTLAAVLILWLCFHGAGWLLLKIPTPVHEGTFWTDALGGSDR